MGLQIHHVFFPHALTGIYSQCLISEMLDCGDCREAPLKITIHFQIKVLDMRSREHGLFVTVDLD